MMAIRLVAICFVIYTSLYLFNFIGERTIFPIFCPDALQRTRVFSPDKSRSAQVKATACSSTTGSTFEILVKDDTGLPFFDTYVVEESLILPGETIFSWHSNEELEIIVRGIIFRWENPGQVFDTEWKGIRIHVINLNGI
jgi:hypothetical protein